MISMRIPIITAMIIMFALPSTVLACSAMPTIETMTQMGEVVAFGTFTDTNSDVATFAVEEYWKGNLQTRNITINNHYFATSDDCSLELGPSPRFEEGQHFVLFLQKDTFQVGADWRPTGPGGTFALFISGDQAHYGDEVLGSISSVRTQVMMASNSPTSLPVQSQIPTIAIEPPRAITLTIPVATIATLTQAPLIATKTSLATPNANEAANTNSTTIDSPMPVGIFVAGIGIMASVLVLLFVRSRNKR